MKEKGFTLVELLAVIIILGLLLTIAVPMIIEYVEQSKKKTYISNVQAFTNGLAHMVTSGEVPTMYDDSILYYIPFNCIELQKGGKSPCGSGKKYKQCCGK